jgi:D-glycero-alpha-D-manno-heptose-7-phosphate kinase
MRAAMQSAPAVRASAPARVDLAGGTLDIWPVSVLVDGAMTVNVAIARRARAEVSDSTGSAHRLRAEDLDVETSLPLGDGGGAADVGPLPLHEAILRHVLAASRPRPVAISVRTRSEVPAGSGLGGSSALAVALLSALWAHAGRRASAEEIASVARDLEARVIQAPTGTQDHLAAIHGGLSSIAYGPGRVEREPIPLAAAEIERRGVLCYLGASRASARANWDMLRRFLDGDPATRRGLSAIAGVAREVRQRLLAGDIESCGPLLAAEWRERRGLSPEVSTPATETALEAARGAGATGGKICGAGGGGCLFVLGAPDARPAIEAALRSAGCEILEFRVASEGLKIESAPA